MTLIEQLESGTALLSVRQLAKVTGTARTTIMREVQRGHLKAVRVGKLLRFEPRDVAGWLHGGQREASQAREAKN
jgi:excisionase family DNA binding protein